jgi:hypothetical protein
MPRLTHIVHPYFGRLPVNTHECPSCGVPAGQTCYLMCPRSPAYQSPEQERDDALRTEAEIAAVGFMAWDSAQHKAHGLPCPYDSDPDPDNATPAPTVTYVPDPGPWPDDDDLPF